MPYTFDWEPPWGLLVRFSGAVTLRDWREAVLELCADARYVDLRYAIMDFTAGHCDLPVRADRDVIDAGGIARGVSFANPQLKRAVVATDRSVLALMAEHARFVRRPYQVFETLDSARAWARLPQAWIAA